MPHALNVKAIAPCWLMEKTIRSSKLMLNTAGGLRPVKKLCRAFERLNSSVREPGDGRFSAELAVAARADTVRFTRSWL